MNIQVLPRHIVLRINQEKVVKVEVEEKLEGQEAE
jgi:hypothetical protein